MTSNRQVAFMDMDGQTSLSEQQVVEAARQPVIIAAIWTKQLKLVYLSIYKGIKWIHKEYVPGHRVKRNKKATQGHHGVVSHLISTFLLKSMCSLRMNLPESEDDINGQSLITAARVISLSHNEAWKQVEARLMLSFSWLLRQLHKSLALLMYISDCCFPLCWLREMSWSSSSRTRSDPGSVSGDEGPKESSEQGSWCFQTNGDLHTTKLYLSSLCRCPSRTVALKAVLPERL